MTAGRSLLGACAAPATLTHLAAGPAGQWSVLGQVDTHTFGLNVFFIIGLLVVGSVAIVLAVVGWTVLRTFLWRRSAHRAEVQARQGRRGEDGRVHPPTERGLCDACALVFNKVYHLASGQRLCESCYRQMVQQTREQAVCTPRDVPQAIKEAGTDDERRKAGIDVVRPEGDGRQGL